MAVGAARGRAVRGGAGAGGMEQLPASGLERRRRAVERRHGVRRIAEDEDEVAQLVHAVLGEVDGGSEQGAEGWMERLERGAHVADLAGTAVPVPAPVHGAGA